MENRWSPSQPLGDPLAECVYGSRLIGSDPALVLHGGGNTSVKASFSDITGRQIPSLFVKGSGWDLATIEAAGFAPLHLERLRELLGLEQLSDEEMMRELSAARLDPGAPQPSVETLLHAFLPYPSVLHSHADVIVTLTNLAGGERLLRDLYGTEVVIVPYVMPGFDLAREVRRIWPEQAGPTTSGMVLLNHGLFTFGATTEEAYHRHLSLISRAETWLDRAAPWSPPVDSSPVDPIDPEDLALFRRDLSHIAGAPMIVSRHTDAVSRRFTTRDDLDSLADRGPLTPDHVIRTKRVAMVGRDLIAYADRYREYFDQHQHRGRVPLIMLDPAPRVILDPDWGMFTAGRTAGDASIAADIYQHTIPVLERAEDHLGGYQALTAAELFDCEYWDLEQAKLRRRGTAPEYAGMAALVTGAASGIGRACAEALLSRGAAVVGIDQSGAVEDVFSGPAWYGVVADVTDVESQAAAVRQAVDRFGGIDMAVVAAGVFGASQSLGDLDRASWEAVMAVNVGAVAGLFSLLDPLLRLSPVGGRVVVIASKNVAAPGPGAAAYSASKAAVTQLARVAALEWAPAGIRVNVVHPDAVFDTGLWDLELIERRAAKYGLTAEEYRHRNLLSVEVDAATVAGVVAELCSDRFRATTGAQIPIDGGNERVI